jgi:Xaa-Pro aminopeptidase
MPDPAEFAAKVARVRELLSARGAACALIGSRAGFAWLTGGGRSHVNHAAEAGVAVIAVAASDVVLLCSNIEAGRMRDEEIVGLPIVIRDFAWHDPAARLRAFAEVAAGKAVADAGVAGVPAEVDRGLIGLRYRLLPAEVERYREGGRRVGEALGRAGRLIEPGLTEQAAAGLLHKLLLEAGTLPWVTLVAADGRIAAYRHPIPTQERIERRAMLVTCSEYKGLITAATRLVSFGPIDADLRRRHDAVCRVDAALIAGTRPGRTIGEALADGVAAYAAEGFADEWKHHHQGGPCGYAPRESIATPGAGESVQAGQAFAWNPSIAGTKSEDTIIVGAGGPEVISGTAGWPTAAVQVAGRRLERADILIR